MEKLTLGDWISFLSGEKHGITGHVMNFYAILVSVAALLWSVFDNPIVRITVFGILIIFLFGFNLYSQQFSLRTKAAKDILERIMRGCLTNPDDVRKEWLCKAYK
jgi:hypothetical protein